MGCINLLPPETCQGVDVRLPAFEQVDGVRFRELAEQLSLDGGASGDEALHAVVGMARYMAAG